MCFEAPDLPVISEIVFGHPLLWISELGGASEGSVLMGKSHWKRLQHII